MKDNMSGSNVSSLVDQLIAVAMSGKTFKTTSEVMGFENKFTKEEFLKSIEKIKNQEMVGKYFVDPTFSLPAVEAFYDVYLSPEVHKQLTVDSIWEAVRSVKTGVMLGVVSKSIAAVCLCLASDCESLATGMPAIAVLCAVKVRKAE